MVKDHLEKLIYFYEIARCKNMKRASENLYLTQPSLTKSIKVLEESIGSKLFERNPRGVGLTQEGEVLFEYCKTLFPGIRDLESRLLHPGDPMSGSIRIGTYDSIAIYFWPKFLKYLNEKYSALDIELMTDRSSIIQSKLETSEIDLALIVEPKQAINLKTDFIFSDCFRFYTSFNKNRTFSKISDAPLIYMPGSFGEGEENLLLGERKIYKTSSLESVKELAINGLGLGLLPEQVAKKSIKEKTLKVQRNNGFKEKIGKHNISLVYSKNREGSSLIQTMSKEIKDFIHKN